MDDDFLTTKFPDMKPGLKPSLGSVNGCGTTLVGQRDHDAETGTYVATQCVCILFIPIIPIAAYRVASAPGGGWYVLGKVPLSKSARRWNLLLALAVFAAIGVGIWNNYTNSPNYLAAKKLRKVDEAAAAGKGGEAARLCREVMDEKSSKVEEAKQKLAGIIQVPPGPPSEAAAVYQIAVDLHRENRCPVQDLFSQGKALAEQYSDSDPDAAIGLLEVIAPFAPDPAAELALRRELLEKQFARDPKNIDAASRLAVACEAKGEFERCEKLLSPFETQLGNRDGAAILGRIYSSRGEYDRAYALLRPFVNSRLPAFQTAQQNLVAQVKAAQERVVNQLKSGNAKGFDFERYKRLGKDQQADMVDGYISDQMKNDVGLRTARQRVMTERGVVSAVLDLGLVQSQRAQKLPDPAARKAELEAAEKTFLSISTFAGESDEYRLSLGQVYYWLGRQEDGKKQFEELLKRQNYDTEAVIQVSRRIREIGDFSEARRLIEDAYEREKDLTKKQSAASIRALLHIDLDDEILWLGRSNPTDPAVAASLASTRGQKAQRDGKDDDAVVHYRRAIEIYDNIPESAPTLNNSAIAFFALYSITHDRNHFTTGIDRLDRAIALQASNSILLSNAAGMVLSGAARDVIGTEVDLKALKRDGGIDTLYYLFYTPSERAAVFARFIQHPGTVKARGYAEKLMTLSPKRADSYSILSSIYNRTRNLEGLIAVLSRLEKSDLDLNDARRESREFMSGESDAKHLGDLHKALERANETLSTVRNRKDRTFAVAAGNYISLKEYLWFYGDQTDADELVKLAEEAHSAAPSLGTVGVLKAALLFRAHLRLTDEDTVYAAIAVKTKRTFGSLLIRYLIGDKRFQDKITNNADIKRLVSINLDEFRRDAENVTATEWAMVRAVSPQEAPAIAAKLQGNERLKVHAKIERIMNPDSINESLNHYWMLQLEGKEKEASQVLAELAARGISVP